ncbi:hypothetical protein CDAR_126721 [Caerostris darwini]|uniref:Uncharacterized protein n=1 Tax=Caerostris darwini TaxID=1538125 RepID=A0AAV4RZ51_9ARAC|nr:hypothetical protein CDAR_126721 [Caerostris darwini]
MPLSGLRPIPIGKNLQTPWDRHSDVVSFLLRTMTTATTTVMTTTTTIAHTIGTNTAGSLRMEKAPNDVEDVEARGGTVAESEKADYNQKTVIMLYV